MLSFFGKYANKFLGHDHKDDNFTATSPTKICWAVRQGKGGLVNAAIEASKAGQVSLDERASWFESRDTPLDLFASSFLSECTPLAVACYTPNRYEVVEALLASGCIDINVKSGRCVDHTPLDCAILWNPDQKLLSLLMANGAKVSQVHQHKLNKILQGVSELPNPEEVVKSINPCAIM